MDVFFSASPEIEIATNRFIDVPTIIQFEDVPLMQVGNFEAAGYTTKFAVYHSDGTKIAVVKGSQVYLTEEGKNASLKMRHEPDLTACELEGRTIFELRRNGAAALKGAAELYAPEGAFIRANDSDMSALRGDGTEIRIAGVQLSDCEFRGHAIGIHITSTGITLGGSGGRGMHGNLGPNYRFHATGGGSIGFTK